MIVQTLVFVLETVFGLFTLAALARFYAQAFRAPFRNPLTDFVVALTDFMVKPLRKIVPGAFGLDWASLVTAWMAQLVFLGVKVALLAPDALVTPSFWPGLILWALVCLVRLSLYLLIGVVLIQAILSWTSPYHPIGPFFAALTRPFLKPIQRVVPLVGGVDLSPLVLLVLVQVVLMLPVAWLEAAVTRLPRLLAA
ncbi:MAG: YggT family protein [Betaproteobacteria bacterium]|nr:YggT family protein [Betaproteobacteria bacterium]